MDFNVSDFSGQFLQSLSFSKLLKGCIEPEPLTLEGKKELWKGQEKTLSTTEPSQFA